MRGSLHGCKFNDLPRGVYRDSSPRPTNAALQFRHPGPAEWVESSRWRGTERGPGFSEQGPGHMIDCVPCLIHNANSRVGIPREHEAGKEMIKPRKSKNPHIGTSLDSFLKQEGIYEDVQTSAIKGVLASQLEQAMKEQKLTKVEMARRMRTSRVQLDRLLDPNNDGVTLATLRRAAAVVGREVRLELV